MRMMRYRKDNTKTQKKKNLSLVRNIRISNIMVMIVHKQ